MVSIGTLRVFRASQRQSGELPVSAGRKPFAEADGNRTRPPTLAGALVLKTRRATRPQSPPGSGYLRSGSNPQNLLTWRAACRMMPVGQAGWSGARWRSFHQLAELLGELSHHV